MTGRGEENVCQLRFLKRDAERPRLTPYTHGSVCQIGSEPLRSATIKRLNKILRSAMGQRRIQVQQDMEGERGSGTEPCGTPRVKGAEEETASQCFFHLYEQKHTSLIQSKLSCLQSLSSFALILFNIVLFFSFQMTFISLGSKSNDNNSDIIAWRVHKVLMIPNIQFLTSVT